MAFSFGLKIPRRKRSQVGYAIWCLFLSQFCLYEIHKRASEMAIQRIPHTRRCTGFQTRLCYIYDRRLRYVINEMISFKL
jgi:hypothetical protein